MTVGPKTSEDFPSAIATAVFEQVRRAVPEGFDCQIAIDTSLDDVGLDSLTRMNVLNSLEEKFGVRFSEESLFDMETCRDLIEYIGASVSPGFAERPSCKREPEMRTHLEITPEQYDPARFPECVAFAQRLQGAAAAGFANPFFRVKERVGQTLTTIGGREVVSYTSFDYVGMARDPRVKAAAKQAIDQFGTSASASRLVGGNSPTLEELDRELAAFIGAEAAIVFPSGYGTNASLFGHLLGEEDLILYDELAHNSIVQGAIASKARRRPFPHNDFEFVDSLLRDIRSSHRRVIVAIEGAYSMDGDYPNLPQFLEVKQRHHAMLYVDEAHSLGTMGPNGRGICEHFGADPRDGDFWMGTISKALGSGGGYLAGPRMLVEYLKYTTPAGLFATGLSPANAAAALASIRLLQEEPDRVLRVQDRSRLFLKLSRDAGLNVGASEDTPIVPVIVGDSLRCIGISAELLRQGIDAQPILYPAVPESLSRIRFFITAEHTEEQICHTVEVVAACLGQG